MSYSRFFLTDLHVHTAADAAHRYGADAGPKDPNPAFANRLVDSLSVSGVEVIAVTDHNRVDWWPILRATGKKAGLVVFPGVEVSVNGCHLIGIWDSNKNGFDLALRFVGGLFRPGQSPWINGAPRPLTGGSIEHYARQIQEHHGLVFAPHSTAKEMGLFGRGVVSNSDEIAQGDLITAFDVFGSKSADVLKNPRSKFGDVPPRWFLSGDVRSFADAGKRATYLKLGSSPSLEGIRQAFLAPVTRVRLQASQADDWGQVAGARFASTEITPSWPRLMALRVDGGFHDHLDIPLAPGLTAIVGGKGSGKSALIEIIRYVLGETTSDKPLRENRERNFPANAEGWLEAVDSDGIEYQVHRSGGTAAPDLSRDGTKISVSVAKRIKCLIVGQRQLVALSEGANLREFVAKLTGDSWADVVEQEQAAIHELDQIADKLASDEREFARLDDAKSERVDLQDRIGRARAAGAEAAIEKSRLLTELNGKIIVGLNWPSSVRRWLDSIDDILPRPALPAGAAPPLNRVLAQLAKALGDSVAGADKATRAALEAVTAIRETWEIEFTQRKAAVERQLADAGVANAQEFPRWQARLGELDASLAALPAREKEHERRLDQRTVALDKLASTRRRKSRTLTKAAALLQAELPDRVRLHLSPFADRTEFRSVLERLVQGQSIRGEQLDRLAALEPRALVATVRQGVDALVGVGVSATTAAKLVSLGPSQLRIIEVADTPDELVLELKLEGSPSSDWRPVSDLSPGQRATALLAMVLAGGTDPLIIDQPEDDLDNRYIYDEVVKVIARVCERRQVIIATHNANIPVLGDAELIVALDADSDQSSVLACGGIEAPEVAGVVRHILEGGEEAFRARHRRYLAAR